jgi:CheY-like chemotaxis protein
LKKAHILIVDDNKITSYMLRLLLENAGYVAECCENGARALDKMKEKGFGILLTDYRMPGMNGDKLTATVRSQYPEVFIVGFSIEAQERAFLDAGANVFIGKDRLAHQIVSVLAAVPGKAE